MCVQFVLHRLVHSTDTSIVGSALRTEPLTYFTVVRTTIVQYLLLIALGADVRHTLNQELA